MLIGTARGGGNHTDAEGEEECDLSAFKICTLDALDEEASPRALLEEDEGSGGIATLRGDNEEE